jgi:FdrA protein
MIDSSVRDDMLRKTLADTTVAAVLVDCIIGLGANADPAGKLAAVVRAASGNAPPVIASVTGTESDPQVRSRQVAVLEGAGILVAPSNAHAAELALALCTP